MFYVSSDILNRIEIWRIEWILPALYAKILTYNNTDFFVHWSIIFHNNWIINIAE